MTSSCSDSFCKALRLLKQAKDLHSTLLTCSTAKIRTATGTQFEIEISQEFVIPFLNIWYLHFKNTLGKEIAELPAETRFFVIKYINKIA